MSSAPIVLALGGGGARGLAHLGVIEVFAQTGIPIDRYVGVSMGSVISAACAFEDDVRVVTRRLTDYVRSEAFQRHQSSLYGTRRSPKGVTPARGFLWFSRLREYLTANRLVHRVMLRPSFLPGKLLEDVFRSVLPDARIEESKTPLTIVSVDLKSGRRIALESGPLIPAVMGSASLPGIFPPVEIEQHLLTDVGVFCSLPTLTARSYGPFPLVAIDVSPNLETVETCETALDVLMRMEEIGGALFRDYVHSLADIVIRPRVGNVDWTDFSTAEDVVEAGRAAAREALPRLLALIPKHRLRPPAPVSQMGPAAVPLREPLAS